MDGVSSNAIRTSSLPSSDNDEERAEELFKSTKAFDQISGLPKLIKLSNYLIL